MQKKILGGVMFAMSIAASAALAEEVSQPPYENGGHYSGQTWNPMAAMIAMPAEAMKVMAQAANTAMQPMAAPYKNHPYVNGGAYGDKASDVASEVR